MISRLRDDLECSESPARGHAALRSPQTFKFDNGEIFRLFLNHGIFFLFPFLTGEASQAGQARIIIMF